MTHKGFLAAVCKRDDEGRKNYWLVTVEGFPPFTMAGEKMTKEEAMHAVQLVWPGMRVSVK